MNMQKTVTKFLILTIVFIFALGVNYLFAAWTGPTQTPPAGNTSTPVHVGTTDQVKNGGLSVDALSVFGGGYFQGNLDIDGGIEIGDTVNETAGTIRWTGADFQGYMGGAWVSLTGAGLACTSFTYSAWGECQSNSTQTRTILTSSPSGCVGGNPVTTQSCTYVLPMYIQCANVGGSWIASQGICYFPTTSCPSGWSSNASYSSTNGASCSGDVGGCSIPNHFRQNTGNTCVYSPAYCAESGGDPCGHYEGGGSATCTATLTEIGCTKN